MKIRIEATVPDELSDPDHPSRLTKAGLRLLFRETLPGWRDVKITLVDR